MKGTKSGAAREALQRDGREGRIYMFLTNIRCLTRFVYSVHMEYSSMR